MHDYAKSITLEERMLEMRREFDHKILIFTKKDEFTQKLLAVEKDIGRINNDIMKNFDDLQVKLTKFTYI